ncbi:glycosyltransferase [Roseomonas stagni]|uniref:Glycosyltransferase n=1 Tax=Falsiroseomonas algicola TaxID=2716930 RepID=A0A6M1LNP3_9PROT|nr:glycosyltransferase [Falsiroseomonas algicola]NGM21652.1 glycosyltransferase [Falsiroseomonas algicola]
MTTPKPFPLPRPAPRPVARIAAAVMGELRRHPGLRAGLRGLAGPALPLLRPYLHALPTADALGYQRWIEEHDTLSDAEAQAMRQEALAGRNPPLLSIVMPAYETPPALLRQAIASLKAQTWPHWELCVVDDASPSSHVEALLSEMAAVDPRIRWRRRTRNGHIARATNDAIGMARGDHVLLMDHDDLLPARALHEVAALIRRHPDLDIAYSDEDKIDGQGRRFAPYFKPDFDPELLRAQNLVSHLGVYSTRLLRRIGGLRPGFNGSQDHDLALRASAATMPARIHHITRILYHWRQPTQGSYSKREAARCVRTSRAAVMESLASAGEVGVVLQPAPLAPGWHRVVYPVAQPRPLVSVLVTMPVGGRLPDCADGVLRRTNWAELEMIVAAPPAGPGSGPFRPLDARLRWLEVPPGTGRAAALNLAAAEARGSLLLMLDEAADVLSPYWVGELASQALRQPVGAVGAKLMGRDGRLLHAGFALDPTAVVRPVAPGAMAGDVGPGGLLALTRQVSAVSGAVMMLRRAVFQAAGGFDEESLPHALHDVDLCLRLQWRGMRVLHTPFAMLMHRGVMEALPAAPVEAAAALEAARAVMRQRWAEALAADPFQNPNLQVLAACMTHAAGSGFEWSRGGVA